MVTVRALSGPNKPNPAIAMGIAPPHRPFPGGERGRRAGSGAIPPSPLLAASAPAVVSRPSI
jgi:hypothetical protein